ncbi:ERI1 exoribonuclease 3 [Patella vulgata]|uniref:ERI1 exoribonuclease 3 n=1 Tax=Patella vulgata TaxID=6465 RepID=UPI0024A7D406|nr:ERI1 exoribonuclease 3 [Patella vulgata]
MQVLFWEIIEFPVLKVNPVTLNVESTFHRYVCPEVHKELTPFCIELTGIIQDMVDGQPKLQKVLQEFDDWMKQEGLLNEGVKFAFVTCGDWDLKLMLPKQCDYFHIKPEDYFNQWINLKRSFSDVMSVFPQGMMPMLSQLKLKHQGRHHSGIDDCKNIANIVIELLKRGYVFKYTGRLQQAAHSR